MVNSEIASRDLRSKKGITMRLSSLSSLAALLLCTSLADVAVADASHRDGHCRRIRAEIDLTNGTIEGNFGLNGSVAFAQDSRGTAPTTAPVTSSVFSGILTLATAHGNLVLRETGMFTSRTGNPAGALFASFGETLSGTDRYTGVTGDLFFTGQVVGDVFLIQVTGELCRP
jgi:hypothetical protein